MFGLAALATIAGPQPPPPANPFGHCQRPVPVNPTARRFPAWCSCRGWSWNLYCLSDSRLGGARSCRTSCWCYHAMHGGAAECRLETWDNSGGFTGAVMQCAIAAVTARLSAMCCFLVTKVLCVVVLLLWLSCWTTGPSATAHQCFCHSVWLLNLCWF